MVPLIKSILLFDAVVLVECLRDLLELLLVASRLREANFYNIVIPQSFTLALVLLQWQAAEHLLHEAGAGGYANDGLGLMVVPVQ